MMSQRHRSDMAVLPPKVETRAHARGERHRVNTEMLSVAHQVFAGVEPDDAYETGNHWKPIHHHDADRAKEQEAKKGRKRHWKLKMWKRRTAARKAKAAAYAGQPV
jgi:hypothetical protein